MNKDEDYMKLALGEADKSVASDSLPFAAIAVDETGEVVGKDHDRVQENFDPTAHAEINLIRRLCSDRKSTNLADLTFYTTSEPCPTCLTAMIKARVRKCVYGAKTETTASLPIPAEEIAARSRKYPIEVIGGVLAEECLLQRETYFSKSQPLL